MADDSFRIGGFAAERNFLDARFWIVSGLPTILPVTRIGLLKKVAVAPSRKRFAGEPWLGLLESVLGVLFGREFAGFDVAFV